MAHRFCIFRLSLAKLKRSEKTAFWMWNSCNQKGAKAFHPLLIVPGHSETEAVPSQTTPQRRRSGDFL